LRLQHGDSVSAMCLIQPGIQPIGVSLISQSHTYLALPAGKTCLMDLLPLNGKSARVVPHKLDHGSGSGMGGARKMRNATIDRLACHFCVGVESIRAAADECLAARAKGPRALFECRNSMETLVGRTIKFMVGRGRTYPFRVLRAWLPSCTLFGYASSGCQRQIIAFSLLVSAGPESDPQRPADPAGQ
jgi:hypothetical protein